MYRPRRFVILKHLKKQAAKNGLLFSLVVLGVDVVGKCLDVLLSVVVVAVVVVVLLANKLHLENAAALGAALDGALLVHLFVRRRELASSLLGWYIFTMGRPII